MSEDKNKLDQKSEEKNEPGGLGGRGAGDQSSLPLYLRDKSEGNRSNAQDEKDKSAE
jgi:hypothetical protein